MPHCCNVNPGVRGGGGGDEDYSWVGVKCGTTYGVGGVLGAVDGDDPFEQVVLRDQVDLHIFRRLRLEVRKLLDCCVNTVDESWLGGADTTLVMRFVMLVYGALAGNIYELCVFGLMFFAYDVGSLGCAVRSGSGREHWWFIYPRYGFIIGLQETCYSQFSRGKRDDAEVGKPRAHHKVCLLFTRFVFISNLHETTSYDPVSTTALSHLCNLS